MMYIYIVFIKIQRVKYNNVKYELVFQLICKVYTRQV